MKSKLVPYSVIDESDIKGDFISAFILVDALQILFIVILGGILGIIVGISAVQHTERFAQSLIMVFYIAIFIAGFLLSVKNYIHVAIQCHD